MPVKFFCDECGAEVYDPSHSLDMTGKIYCSKHFPKPSNVVYKISWDFKKKKHPFRVEEIKTITDKSDS